MAASGHGASRRGRTPPSSDESSRRHITELKKSGAFPAKVTIQPNAEPKQNRDTSRKMRVALPYSLDSCFWSCRTSAAVCCCCWVCCRPGRGTCGGKRGGGWGHVSPWRPLRADAAPPVGRYRSDTCRQRHRFRARQPLSTPWHAPGPQWKSLIHSNPTLPGVT